MDVVQLVKEGKCRYEWAEVSSKHNGYTLYIDVFRDAMKFDGVPAMTWDFKVLDSSDTYDGVRLPATAHQMQEIADLLNCMLLTPKVIDMIWLQAEIKFSAIVNVKGRIVAVTNIHDLHKEIEDQVEQHLDDGEALIACVGKYWCLVNELEHKGMLHGDWTCCNYGWCAYSASGPGVTPGVRCWQRPGFRHNKQHWDPSQTIRLMSRIATLYHPDGTEEEVDLHDIAADPKLAPLISHQGVLTYLRQKGVGKLEPLLQGPKSTPTIEEKDKKGFWEIVFEIFRV